MLGPRCFSAYSSAFPETKMNHVLFPHSVFFFFTFRLQHLAVLLLWLLLNFKLIKSVPCLWPCTKFAYKCNKIQFLSCGTSTVLDCFYNFVHRYLIEEWCVSPFPFSLEGEGV